MAAFRPQESSSLFLDVKMGGGGGVIEFTPGAAKVDR